MKITRYGLRLKKTGELLGFEVSSNLDSEDRVPVIFVLDNASGNPLWLVNSAEQAEYVRAHSTQWYNADYVTPNHQFKAEDLEVVLLEIYDGG